MIICGGMPLLQNSSKMKPRSHCLSVWKMAPNDTVRTKPSQHAGSGPLLARFIMLSGKVFTEYPEEFKKDNHCSTSCLLVMMFSNKYFKNTIRVSDSLDPDLAQHFVWPDLESKLIAKDVSRRH